jgi:hypothetical protein
MTIYPAPKPAKREKQARKPMKKRKPSAKETARSMGTLARRLFVASLPCAACGIVGYSVSAHLLGNGGIGRKKDHTTTGPLCRARGILPGCHNMYDERRYLFDSMYPEFNAVEVAAETERAWVQRSDAGGER